MGKQKVKVLHKQDTVSSSDNDKQIRLLEKTLKDKGKELDPRTVEQIEYHIAQLKSGG